MLPEEKIKILDINVRYGRNELIKYVRELEDAEILDMLIKNGHGESVREWFKEIYPDYFQTESAEDRAYWNDVDFRGDLAREEAVLNAG